MEWSGSRQPQDFRTVSGLIYARAKTGKSRLLASAPGPVLVWDFDYNFPVDVFPAGQVAVERPKDYRQFREQLLKIKAAPEGTFGIEYEGHIFRTAGLDTLTNLYPLIMEDALKLEVKRETTTRVGTSQPSEVVEREIAVIQDFLLTGERLKKIIRDFRQLPCHFFAVAHE